MNLIRNADFFIELAEKGKSFAPHIPVRDSDRVGLFREICRKVSRRKSFCETVTLSEKTILVRSSSSISARRRLYIASEEGGLLWMSTRIRDRNVSAIARYRLLMYFAPILTKSDYGYLRLLEEGDR